MALADLVILATQGPKVPLKSLYTDVDPVDEKIKKIINKVYGIDGVVFSNNFIVALNQEAEKGDLSGYDICMCKTPYNFGHDPKNAQASVKGPFQVSGLNFHHGAKLIIPICGESNFMPGTISNPLFKQMDLDFSSDGVMGL